MNRRFAIKQVLILAGGIVLLPSCLKDAGKSSIQLRNLDISLDQENLLAEMVETILPKTNTPGAKELNVHLFVLKMLDDCYEPADQDKFLKGFDQIIAASEKQFDKSFTAITVKQRQALFINAESETSSAEQQFFYKTLKRRTVSGYMNSQYVMTNLVKYQLIPGRYENYLPVKSA